MLILWPRFSLAQVHITLLRSLSHSLFPVAPTRSIGHPWNASFHFSFLILYTVGRTPWMVDQPVARTTQTQNKRRQISMPWVGFEPTIPAFEQAKTVHTSDSAATVVGTTAFGWVDIFRTEGRLWAKHQFFHAFDFQWCYSYFYYFTLYECVLYRWFQYSIITKMKARNCNERKKIVNELLILQLSYVKDSIIASMKTEHAWSVGNTSK
jgi:hypothetical protein